MGLFQLQHPETKRTSHIETNLFTVQSAVPAACVHIRMAPEDSECKTGSDGANVSDM